VCAEARVLSPACLGCVLRSEVWAALQDGPGNLYTGGPFLDEACH